MVEDSFFVFLQLGDGDPSVIGCPVGRPMGGVDPTCHIVPDGHCQASAEHDVPVIVVREATLC